MDENKNLSFLDPQMMFGPIKYNASFTKADDENGKPLIESSEENDCAPSSEAIGLMPSDHYRW